MRTEQELEELYDRLSMADRLGQLTQLHGRYYDEEGGELTGPVVAGMEVSEEDVRYAGSLLNTYGAERLRRIQEAHMRYSRVPMIFMGDVLAGCALSQPIPLAQACSFDPDLVRALARSAAQGAAAEGVTVTFAPMVDISRDARWGRVCESYGEDACLTARMARAAVEGFQGDSPDALDGIASCVKHFAAYGGCEAGRDYNNVELSERTLRETYLAGYKAAVDAGCEALMPSFNTIGGVPASLDPKLLRDILRGEWGFRGPTISDWTALLACRVHGAVQSERDIARYGMEAGVDIAMMDYVYAKYTPELLESGELDPSLFREAVIRVLRLKDRQGILDDPYRYLRGGTVDMDSQYAAALRGVEEGCVLLKNDGQLLPLSGGTVALIGPYAVRERAVCMWNNRSLHGAGLRKLPKDAMEEVLGREVLCEPGCAILEAGHFLNQDTAEDDPCLWDPSGCLERALAAAKKADVAVLMLGEHFGQSGESSSRADLSLPEIQMDLLRRTAAVNPNVVSVIFAGRPVDLREVTALSKAVLYAWMPGDAGSEGIAGLLTGRAVPSGKLAMSIPYHAGQCPIHYDLYPTCRPAKSQQDRFTSRYLDVPVGPLFPFGYGLSYTSFAYSAITADRTVLTADRPIRLSVTLTNTGRFRGTEAVQLYLRDVAATLVSRPMRELKDFKRVSLDPGESAVVTFQISEPMLRFHDRNCRLISEPGEHIAYIGGDSTAENALSFTYAPCCAAAGV